MPVQVSCPCFARCGNGSLELKFWLVHCCWTGFDVSVLLQQEVVGIGAVVAVVIVF